MRNSKFIIVACLLLMGCGGKLAKRSTLDEVERTKYAVSQQAEQVVKAQPLQVETTSPEGTKTIITTAPESKTTYSLSDNTSASSVSSLSTYTSIGMGVSMLFNIGLAMIGWTLWSKLSATGLVFDKIGSHIIHRLASMNDPEKREELLHIKSMIGK